jgi:hypothetical protein
MKLPVIIFIACIFVLPVQAQLIKQEVIASAGGYNVSGDISLSWTLGETIIETFSSGALVLTHGFQQKLIVTTVKENPYSSLNVILFPNPAGDFINIQTDPPADTETDILLVDLQGKTLKTDKIGVAISTARFNLQDVPPGIYFIKIIKGKLINIYRVVKL